MIQQPVGTFAFAQNRIIRNAPAMSGVYTLHSGGPCLCVGDSLDICGGLLEHDYDDNPCLNDKVITHFTFDLVPPEARTSLLINRIRQLTNLSSAGRVL